MPSVRGDNLIAIRLDDGEDFFPSFEKALGDTSTAVIISAIGMFRDFELGWLGPEGYAKHLFHEPFELLSICGSINRKPDGLPFIHFHASLSGPDHMAVGGHLFKGIVNNTCEMVLLVPEVLVFHRRILKPEDPPRFCPESV
ncbi:MAG: hypothetical protein STSR0007_09950 [Thermovirga sp.]